jgi:selenocysteine-specific elongation factor
MIVGTAGHINHGKTALVKRLTGVDTDRLKEEKARGITIDLGFAYRAVEGSTTLAFVDVPGHERLIHNMLAGASGIEFVLLVVAADDGVMPQTREHLQIVGLLGLADGAVALTKTDLVSAERLAEAAAEIGELLAGTPLAGAPLFPLSCLDGSGVGALAAHLEAKARCAVPRTPEGNFRLAVDRCFTLAGAGTVLTGCVHSGEVHEGDRLLVSPSGIEVRVRAIHAHNRPARHGRAGERCALNVAGPQVSKEAIRRGDWIVAEAAHAPSARLDVELALLPTERARLKHWTPVHLHLGAGEVNARVALLEQPLAPGTTRLAQLVLERPVGALHGERFIVRDQSASRTLGGGRVLDPFAPARRRRSPERISQLAAWRLAKPEASLAALLAAPPHHVDLGRFAAAWNLTAAEVARLERAADIAKFDSRGTLFVAARERWNSVCSAIVDALRAGGAVAVSDLRRKHAIPARLFDACVDDLARAKRIVRDGTSLSLQRVAPVPDAIWPQLEREMAAQGLRPARAAELARGVRGDAERIGRALRLAAAEKRAFQVSPGHFLLPEALAKCARSLEEIERREGACTLARFRDELQLGRRTAVEILEFFDRAGFTVRSGEARRLRRSFQELFGARG